MDGGIGEILVGDQTLVEGFHQMLVGGAQVHIAAGLQGQGGGFRHGFGIVVVFENVGNGAGIGDKVAVILPLLTENFLDQLAAGAAGGTVGAVVGTHEAGHIVLHCPFKGGEVGFKHQFPVGNRVKFMA